jgi:salicylate hydroxylase
VDLRYIRDTYGYPRMVGHGASLVGALFNACKREISIQFFFATAAEEVTTFSPKESFTV